MTDLASTVKKIFTPAKGVLASDESINSANKNLEAAGVAGTEENRRRYRELFINTPGFEQYVSGIILSDETFWQTDSEGKLFRETLKEKGVVIVIKVDEGLFDFPGHDGEKISLGLDGLPDRLPNYYENGARAAKWRTVFKISEATPSKELVDTNATTLALYSLMCHEYGIVPIIEPEVLLDGDHSFVEAQDVTHLVLRRVFEKLEYYNVDLSQVILKTSMVLPGAESKEKAVIVPEDIGQATVDVLKESVPVKVPGIVFLSGGQEAMEATHNMNAIAMANDTDWPMTFSFLRAIEGPALETWRGNDKKIKKAREVFLKKLELDSLAMQGGLDTLVEV